MTNGIDERSREDGSQKVAKSVTLLQHTRNDTPRLLRTILQRRRSRIPIEPTHRNPKQRPHTQKLLIRLAKPRSKFQDDKQHIVDYERPLPPIPIRSQSKNDTAYGPQHEHERNTPCNVCFRLAKCFGEILDGKRHSEKIECIPGPGEKGNEEEEPLLRVEEAEEADGIGDFGHGGFERGEACCSIAACRHLDFGRRAVETRGVLLLWFFFEVRHGGWVVWC